MPIAYNVAEAENGQKFVTVFANGTLTAPVDDSHANFLAIIGACEASTRGEHIDPQDVLDLFDIPTTIARKFARLSDRVTVENNELCFDGDPCQPGLSKQILRFLDEGNDVDPLVNFMEKIMLNPSDHSREQAWAWLDHHDFSVTPEGDVVAYKGVYADGNGGYRSSNRGHAFVNDEEVVNDYVPNAVGYVVHMPRSEVTDDPHTACHSGLHVGTYSYAQSWARGAMLRVVINPRDIVSVPHDASGQKIRVCRYMVDAIITAQDDAALVQPETTFEQFKNEDPDGCDLDVTMPVEEPRNKGEHPLPVGTRVWLARCPDIEGIIAGALDEDEDYWVEAAQTGDGCYVHFDEVRPHESSSEYIAPVKPIEVGSKVMCPDGYTGTVVSFYKGHRGKRARVRHLTTPVESYYVADLVAI